MAAALLAVPALAATKAKRVTVDTVPRPRPALKSDAPPVRPDPPMDLSKALPGAALATLPSSARQLGDLKSELAKDRPALDSARQESTRLAAEAASLRRRLVDTATRIESLEREKIKLAGDIQTLAARDTALTQSFARDRISVTRLLAILERLQHDMPPALVVRPDDALAAARGAMLIGATVPPIYQKAADLARRIQALKTTRQALVARRVQAGVTATALTAARADLEQLFAAKARQAGAAADTYDALKTRLAVIARQAADFQALVTRVAALRRIAARGGPDVVTVTAANTGGLGPLTKGSLLQPVVGTPVPPEGGDSGASASRNPGLTFAAAPGAQVIAPADGKVLFAGPYHKSGQVLILEITTGYDLVLAGLGRIDVRLNDELLAGEPVGTMPLPNGTVDNAPVERLYFELRQNGHGLDPAPWISLQVRKAKKT